VTWEAMLQLTITQFWKISQVNLTDDWTSWLSETPGDECRVCAHLANRGHGTRCAAGPPKTGSSPATSHLDIVPPQGCPRVLGFICDPSMSAPGLGMRCELSRC